MRRSIEGENTGRRRYTSPRRLEDAARTRGAIVEAAARLFAERGWRATGMRDVAAEAGVAVETVYAHFKSKPDLLLAVFDVAVVGDNRPIALTDRPEFARMAEGSLADRASAAARLVADVYQRTAKLSGALREAAAGNPQLARALAAGEERRRLDVTQGAQFVAERAPDRFERDSLWALLSVEVYQLLVDRSGWTVEEYQGWAAQMIVQILTGQKVAAPGSRVAAAEGRPKRASRSR